MITLRYVIINDNNSLKCAFDEVKKILYLVPQRASIDLILIAEQINNIFYNHFSLKIQKEQ